MKKSYLFLILLGSILIFSCSKKDIGSSQNAAKEMINVAYGKIAETAEFFRTAAQ